MAGYKPKLVITIHGIRTHAEWQKQVAALLSARNIPTHALSYGFYSLWRFLLRPSNDAMVERFCADYQRIVDSKDYKIDVDDDRRRPSIIAHSFGTYIVGYCMLKYEHVKFDKVIFCGSILPADFDWSTLLHRDQVHLVRNEYGLQDPWTRRVGKLVPRTGEGGAKGFSFISNNFDQQRFDYFKHSDFFGDGHVKNHWLPFLAREPSPLYVRHGREVDDPGEFTQMLTRSRETIDGESYGGLPHYPEAALPPDLSQRWIGIESDIYTFLMDRRQKPLVQGYINAMPLEREAFDRMKAGKLLDKDIGPDDITPYASSDRVLLYLMSIAVVPEVRQGPGGLVNQALEKLLCGVVDKLIHYAHAHGTRVSEIAAVGWTPAGRRLCKWLGMKEMATDCFGNPVFWADLESDEFLNRPHQLHPVKRLVETYRN